MAEFLVLVCGSRDWDDYQTVFNALSKMPRNTIVMHGASKGADNIAGYVAETLGFETREFPADWRGKGRAAGPIRNLEMLNEKPHLVVAFQRNGSRGTQHTIDNARKREIPVELYTE